MPQNVITLSIGTDIPNSVDPDQKPQNVITLSIGTELCLSKWCKPRSDTAECNNPKYWDRYSKQCRPRSEAAECNNPKYWDRYSKQCRPRSEAAECNNPKYWDRYSKQCRPRSDAAKCNYPKYWDRYVFANSIDPDQMQQNVITLSTGTDMSFQTVYTQIRCRIIWPLIRVYTVCHTYSNDLDTLSRMDYYKYCK